MRAAYVVKRNSLVWWRMWRASFFFSLLNPVLFLSAIGLGMGAMVGERNPDAFGSAGYLAFFSTGMLAATCMQSGVFMATFPILGKIVWQRNYEAMLTTPLRVRDIYVGELVWMGALLSILAIPFFAVMTAFGVPESPTAILSVPVAIFTGICFGAAVMAYTATLENDGAYVWMFRLIVTPLFLFSGIFFPIEGLPSWATVVANLTPLYHGVELVRGLNLGGLSLAASTWHLAYLAAFFAGSVALGLRNFNRRLIV